MDRISKSIFRSLLRWTRKPDLAKTFFAIDPEIFELPKNYRILSAEGINAAIFHSFRTRTLNQENIDKGFRLMRVLNESSEKIKIILDEHNRHKEEADKALFKIGQIVHNKVYDTYGVVAGWHMNDKGKQYCKCLYQSNTAEAVFTDSNDLEPVNDPLFARINNEHIKNYFYFFDAENQRFFPREELLFRFPSDVDDASFAFPLTSSLERIAVQNINNGIDSFVREIETILQPLTCLKPSNAIEEEVFSQLLVEISHSIETIHNPKSLEASPLFVRKILRGGSLKSQPRLLDSLPLAMKSALFDNKDQLDGLGALYEKLTKLHKILNCIDDLTKIRFQFGGPGYVYRLRVKQEEDSFAINVLPLDARVKEFEQKPAVSSFKYEIGQVVQHKFDKFRGVVIYREFRPNKINKLLDLENNYAEEYHRGYGDDVFDYTRDQPFYRILYHEPDGQSDLTDQYIPDYAPESILSEITNKHELIIVNQRIPYFFSHWDLNSQRFVANYVLKYLFPQGNHSLPSDYPQSNHINTHSQIIDSNANKIESESLAFKKLDVIMIQLFEKKQELLNSIRKETSSSLFSLQFLTLLIKHSPTRELTFVLEKILFDYLLDSHDDHNVRVLLAIAEQLRVFENYEEAKKVLEVARSLDESHAVTNKALARLYFSHLVDGEKVRQYANEVLRTCPFDYKTLALIGNSYPKEEIEKKIEYFEKALELNPWDLLSLEDLQKTKDILNETSKPTK